MEETATVAVTGTYGYDVGDHVHIETVDPRRWRRFMCWILRKPAPTVSTAFELVHVMPSEITIKPLAAQ